MSPGARAATPLHGAAGDPARLAARAALAAAGLVALALASLAGLAGAGLGGIDGFSGGSHGSHPEEAPSALALREIPARYLALYQAAAVRYGLDWAILAGIGRVECDHGQDPDPACTVPGAVNSAGAGGPMQFLASTWASYGVSAYGTGPPDRWNPADAIYSAANYLRASGAPGDYRRAIYAYNHASWYVEQVLGWARRYRASGAPEAGLAAQGGLAAQTTTPVRVIPGERAELDPADGHLALIPAGAPPVVQALLVAGNELQSLPYGPDGHPDPLGAPDEDCSSTVNYVLYRAGIRPLDEILRENPLAQSYVSWGEPGPGRWVTIYASASPQPHVFIVIAGLRLDTAAAADTGPNQGQQGPRWRLLDHIPDWEHWSVRHPAGL